MIFNFLFAVLGAHLGELKIKCFRKPEKTTLVSMHNRQALPEKCAKKREISRFARIFLWRKKVLPVSKLRPQIIITLLFLFVTTWPASAQTTLYSQNFESPNGYVASNYARDMTLQSVNSIYANQPTGFIFSQLFTVETLNLTGGTAFPTLPGGPGYFTASSRSQTATNISGAGVHATTPRLPWTCLTNIESSRYYCRHGISIGYFASDSIVI